MKGKKMYTLTFIDWEENETVEHFDDSSAAVNAAVYLQYMEGGYNTSSDWSYKVTNENGRVIYEDTCMRYF
jgi:hypothetical protein